MSTLKKKKKTSKKKKTLKERKSPAESATLFPEGTIKDNWVVVRASNGVPRWVPELYVELNGFRKFTVNYAAKHIGSPIKLYSREPNNVWPSKSSFKGSNQFIFTPNGDAIKNKKTIIKDWLRTQKPKIKLYSHFIIDGPFYYYSKNNSKNDGDFISNGLSVDSREGQIVSDNLLNSELFVRVY